MVLVRCGTRRARVQVRDPALTILELDQGPTGPVSLQDMEAFPYRANSKILTQDVS
jgi:hypothetical protein